MSLKNRAVVISGAGGELAAALAGELAARGANLALLGRNADKLEALRASLALPDSRLLSRVVDLASPDEISAAAAAVAERFGRVDALLHLAGGWTGGRTLLEADPADLRAMLDQHVWTSFHAVRAFLPRLLAGGWGRVIMVGTPLASRPNAKGGPYAIGKAGQEALLLALSQELRGTGVTANLLLVRTIDAGREKLSTPAPANAAWTTPEELCAAVLYLLSEEAGPVNGARIPLFGAYV
jgi:NAD(P)-dependent dehydrogenase (short-subunit alcohol dehydrogenase family)